MTLECGQVTELMRNRPTVNTALLYSTCLHMSGDHSVTITTHLRVHKGLDDVLPMNVKGNWKSTGSIHRQVCFRKRDQSTEVGDKKLFR